MLGLDIVTKTIVVKTLADRAPLRLLGGLLTLLETRNPGAAFSLGGPSETIIFSLIAIGVIVFIVREARRIYSAAWAVALGLLLGGATGNLTDRIFRAPGVFRGWVVDWIELPHWPVFNVADSAITCGGVLMVLLAVLGRSIQGSSRPAPADGEPADPPAQPGEHQPAAGHQPGGEIAPAKDRQPAQSAPDPATPDLEVPDQPAPGEADAGQHPAPGSPGASQPGWPEHGQPQSHWPEPAPDTDDRPQQHPAPGSGG